MNDENGNVMSEKDIIREALDLMSDVLFLLYETESDNAKAACWMADSLSKFMTVLFNNGDVLLASADYSSYENKLYKSFLRKKKCKEEQEFIENKNAEINNGK